MRIELEPKEALILFEFLSRYASDEVLSIVHDSETIVLDRICGDLEKQLVEPFDPSYLTLLESARNQISGGPSE